MQGKRIGQQVGQGILSMPPKPLQRGQRGYKMQQRLQDPNLDPNMRAQYEQRMQGIQDRGTYGMQKGQPSIGGQAGGEQAQGNYQQFDPNMGYGQVNGQAINQQANVQRPMFQPMPQNFNPNQFYGQASLGAVPQGQPQPFNPYQNMSGQQMGQALGNTFNNFRK